MKDNFEVVEIAVAAVGTVVAVGSLYALAAVVLLGYWQGSHNIHYPTFHMTEHSSH